jgi:hypothetical protein
MKHFHACNYKKNALFTIKDRYINKLASGGMETF